MSILAEGFYFTKVIDLDEGSVDLTYGLSPNVLKGLCSFAPIFNFCLSLMKFAERQVEGIILKYLQKVASQIF